MNSRLELFVFELGSRGNPDLVARRDPENGAYYKERRKFGTPVAAAHLGNNPNYGVYLLTGSKTSLLVFDLDDHNGALPFSAVAEKGKLIFDVLTSSNLNPMMFRSGGGSGMHVWVAFRNPQIGRRVRAFAQDVLSKLNLKDGRKGLAHGEVEIFPKQDEASNENPGSLIALPLGRKSLPLDSETLDVIELADFAPPGLSQIDSVDLTGENSGRPGQNARRASPSPSAQIVDTAEELATIQDALRKIPADDHDEWIKIGMILKGEFGDDAFDMWHDWSKSSESKYEGEDDCRKRWEGIKPKGLVRLGTLFRMAQQNGWNRKAPSRFSEMNRRYGILVVGAKTLIIIKKPDERSLSVFEYLGPKQLFDLYEAEKLRIGGGEKVSVARAWFASKKADRYTGLEFDPDSPPGDNNGYWNIWRGLAVAPKAGSWRRLEEHIFENIAGGNEQYFHWMLNWMALGVQKPALVIGTVPVLRGLPGTGKGTLAHNYGALFGRHYVTVTQSDQVTGRFNGHFFGRRFIFVDEGIFGGNKKEAGVLKTRITEDYVMLEQKGVDAIMVRNRAIFMVASNNHLVVPADIGDRRWMVLDVGDKHIQDHIYFSAIAAEMANGGREAMLHELLARDITKGPDPRRVLHTEARVMQLLNSAELYIKMLHSFLTEGRLPQNWLLAGNTTTIKAMHVELQRVYSERHLADMALGKLIQEVIPGIKTKPNGNYVAGWSDGEPIKERSTQYAFPPLQEARRTFEVRIGAKVDWGNNLVDWVQEPMTEAQTARQEGEGLP